VVVAISVRLPAPRSGFGDRVARDRQALLPLPTDVFDPCVKVSTRGSSLSLVRDWSNDYSVPTSYGHFDVLVLGYTPAGR